MDKLLEKPIEIDFTKQLEARDGNYIKKLGKVVNVVGLTIESMGPDAKLGDCCRIYPIDEEAKPIMAEVVGFKDDEIALKEIFAFRQKGVTDFGGVIGEFVVYKRTPIVMKKIKSKGIKGLEEIFG